MTELEQATQNTELFDILSPQEEHKTLMGMLDIYEKSVVDIADLETIVLELFAIVAELIIKVSNLDTDTRRKAWQLFLKYQQVNPHDRKVKSQIDKAVRPLNENLDALRMMVEYLNKQVKTIGYTKSRKKDRL